MRLIKLAVLLAIACTATPAVSQMTMPVIDGSGAIAAGGTSQQVFAANNNRVFLRCQNPTAATSTVAAESLFLNYDAPATATGNSEEMQNGGSTNFSGDFVPKGAINIVAATTGHRFVCKQR